MTNEQIAELIQQYSLGGVLRVWEYTRAIEAQVLEHFKQYDAMGYQAYQNTKGIACEQDK